MVWLRSLAIALALGSATWAYAQATGTQPAVKDKSDNLELRLEPKDIQKGMPQGFTFALVNISDHDVRVPVPTARICGLDYENGSFNLVRVFIPVPNGSRSQGQTCSSNWISGKSIMERANNWKLLRPGESLSQDMTTLNDSFLNQGAGRYEVWAWYRTPYILPEDKETLRNAGIDFPQSDLTSTHFTYKRVN